MKKATNLLLNCLSRATERSGTGKQKSCFCYGLVFLPIGLILISASTSSLGQDDFSVPTVRLNKLDPANPTAYRDLAEELSEVENSKNAKDLTIRLYLICATHSSGKIRRSALRGLIHAARTKAEQQKFRALAYLQDAQFSSLLHENDFVQPESDTPANDGKDVNQATFDRLLDALRSLRQGKSRRSKKIMEDEEVRKEFAKYQSVLPLDEFIRACETGDVSDALLLKILEMNAKLRGGDIKPDVSDKSVGAWRVVFKNRLPPRIPKIDLQTVTEFNPANSVFRNGVWRLPTKK